MQCKSLDRKSENHWTVLTGMYPTNLHTGTKSIDMLNKNTPGVENSKAKSEAPVSSYSYMQLKSVISG